MSTVNRIEKYCEIESINMRVIGQNKGQHEVLHKDHSKDQQEQSASSGNSSLQDETESVEAEKNVAELPRYF